MFVLLFVNAIDDPTYTFEYKSVVKKSILKNLYKEEGYTYNPNHIKHILAENLCIYESNDSVKFVFFILALENKFDRALMYFDYYRFCYNNKISDYDAFYKQVEFYGKYGVKKESIKIDLICIKKVEESKHSIVFRRIKTFKKAVANSLYTISLPRKNEYSFLIKKNGFTPLYFKIKRNEQISIMSQPFIMNPF
jgi:hypothetical protein